MKTNWYNILGVTPSAEPEAIKAAYRALAKKFHPDNSETGDAEKFKKIAAAYAVLSNPELRANFDQELHSGRPHAGEAQEHAWPIDFDPAYPVAYPEIDLGAIARDVVTDAAFELGEGFLRSVLGQMSPLARKTFLEAMERRKARKPGSQKAG